MGGQMIEEPRLLQLEGGLRLVYLYQRGAHAGIFGMSVAAGSGSDPDSGHGLAHLVEHTIFKGTNKRSPRHVINRMESIGGELNAFTTKEETTVYAIFPGRGAQRAVELISDLAMHAKFPEKELEKEREVVIDEINSYLDSPSEAIFDELEDMVFAGTRLGHNILGNPESVRGLCGEDCREFLRRNYTRKGSVLFYAGPQSANVVAKLVEKYFAELREGEQYEPAAVTGMKTGVYDERRLENLHQAHVLTAFPAAGLSSELRFSENLFANYIGGPGMNSVLNIELREKRGLVYTVDVSMARFRESGMFNIYFGCDSDDVERCKELCRRAVEDITDCPPIKLQRRLNGAIKQYLGQLEVSLENRENRISGAARNVLFGGATVSLETIKEHIRNTTISDFREIAGRYSERSELIMR